MEERNHSEGDPVLFLKRCKVLLTSSLMINLPVKFIRGNFDYFLGRLNGVFYKEVSALQLFVLAILLFVRTFRVNLTIFNKFKAFCQPVGKGAVKGDHLPGSLKQQDELIKNTSSLMYINTVKK